MYQLAALPAAACDSLQIAAMAAIGGHLRFAT